MFYLRVAKKEASNLPFEEIEPAKLYKKV